MALQSLSEKVLLLWGCVAFAAAAYFPSVGGADDLSGEPARGEYLARAGDCISCHTAPGGKPFAGGQMLKTPFGEISTPNITPDKATGIGEWTDNQFYRALHDGIGRHGEYLYPAFPFPWFTNVARNDVLAIKAYLFTLPPEKAPRKPNRLTFPFDIREGLAAWRAAFFKEGGTSKAPPPQDRLARGAYLVDGLGHCGECHNQHNEFGASSWAGRLEGGAINGWYAPNITGDKREGIGGWSEDRLVQFLKTGGALGKGVALGPMQETIHDSLRFLSDEDLHAVAAFLKSTESEESFRPAAPDVYGARHAPGSGAYLVNCASCHGPDGQGRRGLVPALAGNGVVAAQGPEDVIRVVLGGLPATHGLGPMPAIGASLSDEQVANIVDYVRNSFGNASPATGEPGDVGRLRGRTQTMMDGSSVSLCGNVADKGVMAALDGGGLTELQGMKPESLIPTIDSLLAKVKQAEPRLDRNSVTNSLSAAYCKIVFSDAQATQAERARRIGNFAALVFGQIVSPERLSSGGP